MVSPPKPWERNGAAGTITSAAPTPSSGLASTTAAPTSVVSPQPPGPAGGASSNVPTSTVQAVPERPAPFTVPMASSNLTSPYSSYGASPYSRFGGYGTYGGGYGGGGVGSYGMGTYGGYGGLGTYGGMGYNGYSGYGGYGMGMGVGGMPFGGVQLDARGNPIPTLTQTLETTTQHTFQLLHSIVQTFTGVAQMLESTFMATHSSFFAMVGVIDQFGQLRNALGSVLGLFGLFRWLKDLLSGRTTVTGASTPGGLQHEFREFINGKPVQGPAGPPQKRPSKKPLYIFLLAIFGVPFAMAKLIKVLQRRAQEEAAANNGALPGQPGQLPPLDPSSLTFVRAMYPFAASNPNELSLKENEIVAIMGKLDPRTGAEVDPRLEVDGEWWRGRTRDGREGWFPRKWIEVIQGRKTDAAEPKKVD